MSPSSQKKSEDWGESLKSVLREYAESLLIALFLAVLVRVFIVSAYQVPTVSMNPTLLQGDFIFGYKPTFGFRLPFTDNKIGSTSPERGQVVIFRCPLDTSQRCIKRVIGIEGDRVEMRGKRLIINGEMATYEAATKDGSEYTPLKETYKGESRTILISRAKEKENFGPIMVPPGHFFVLGDSRDSSHDSRDWGSIPLAYLESRPLFVWLSFDWGHPEAKKTLPEVRWSRLFHWVD